MPMQMRETYVVYYEDGSEQQVTTDQRDIVAFELDARRGFSQALEEGNFVTLRRMVWCALKRRNLLPEAGMSNRDWDATVIEVSILDQGEDEAVDPTQPEAGSGTVSGSPMASDRATSKSGTSGRTRK